MTFVRPSTNNSFLTPYRYGEPLNPTWVNYVDQAIPNCLDKSNGDTLTGPITVESIMSIEYPGGLILDPFVQMYLYDYAFITLSADAYIDVQYDADIYLDGYMWGGDGSLGSGVVTYADNAGEIYTIGSASIYDYGAGIYMYGGMIVEDGGVISLAVGSALLSFNGSYVEMGGTLDFPTLDSLVTTSGGAITFQGVINLGTGTNINVGVPNGVYGATPNAIVGGISGAIIATSANGITAGVAGGIGSTVPGGITSTALACFNGGVGATTGSGFTWAAATVTVNTSGAFATLTSAQAACPLIRLTCSSDLTEEQGVIFPNIHDAMWLVDVSGMQSHLGSQNFVLQFAGSGFSYEIAQTGTWYKAGYYIYILTNNAGVPQLC
jgi:hypothetical protein